MNTHLLWNSRRPSSWSDKLIRYKRSVHLFNYALTMRTFKHLYMLLHIRCNRCYRQHILVSFWLDNSEWYCVYICESQCVICESPCVICVSPCVICESQCVICESPCVICESQCVICESQCVNQTVCRK